MTQTIHMRIKHLLEETNDAYTSTNGAMNMDYAGFAAMAISDFKHLLDKPDMTDMELRRMIRKALHQHRCTQPDSCWSTFIARYVTHNANENYKISGSSSHADG